MREQQGGKKRMATQFAATPTLYGRDAEDVLKQIEKRPPQEQIDALKRELASKFEGIQKRGLR